MIVGLSRDRQKTPRSAIMLCYGKQSYAQHFVNAYSLKIFGISYDIYLQKL
jgi:hypothetical protein